MALSAEQVAQIFYQAGARGGDLEFFVAVAKRESAYDPTAHRTDNDPAKLTGDRGLVQINSTWDQQLKDAGIITQASDLFDPVTNAKAAMFVLGKQGRAAWGASAGGYNAGGNPLFNTDVSAAQQAVKNAQTQGLLGKPYTGGSGGGGGGSLPSDASYVRMDGRVYAMFDLGGGTSIYFNVTDQSVLSGRTIQDMTADQFRTAFPSRVAGGDARELSTVTTTFGSFGKFWDSIVEQVMGKNNPAAMDPEVRKIIAEFAGRPDMSQAELQNKLRATKYWQSRTEGELQWNSYSEAERASRRQDTAAKMVSTWVEFAGQNLNMNDPLIQQHVEAVASGKMSWSEWTESYLKPRAAEIPESPWYRQQRTEQENQRQRPIDLENTASKIRQTLQQWGLRWTEADISGWAKGIVGKTRSDDDLLRVVQQQSKVLFPTKEYTLETSTWAAPWLETYGRVMEEDGTVYTPDVAKALSQGTNVWDFEQGLKKSGKWLKTKNARDEMYSLAAEVGSRMGYV